MKKVVGKTRLHALAVLALVFFVAPILSRAQLPGEPYALVGGTKKYDAAIATAGEKIRAAMQERGIPGVTAAVLIDGRIVWADGFGLADVENRVPVWPSTKMRIGSISKALTSAALGLLHEQGKLDFEAPVQTYVPSFPKKRWPINSRLLASHLAGIRHYRGTEFLIDTHYNSVLDGLAIFLDDTLLHEPGSTYHYSSYGWNLLSAIVEGASGQDFLAYMESQVFLPLGMRETVADEVYHIIPHRTRYYERRDGKLINAPFVDNSYKWAGGGFLATASDLVRFADGMMANKILKPATFAFMTTSQKTTAGEEVNYGIGWRIERREGERYVGHGGGSVGGSSALVLQPEAGMAVAIICNTSTGRWWQTGTEILQAFAKTQGE